MDNPADMINAALEELIKQCYEMPAFSTLDPLTGRVRALVYGRIYRAVQSCMTVELQQDLEKLFEVQLPVHRSTFSQLKLVPRSPTLSHLKAWQDRLTWLMELGAMEPLLKDIPPAIVKHFAAEARALDASELQDYTPVKRLTLVVCLIKQAQMNTQDDLIEMFLKRMSTVQVRAKETLQQTRDTQATTTAQLVEALTDLVETAVEDKEQDDATAGKHLRDILEKRGVQEYLLEQCQQVAASLSDEHQPMSRESRYSRSVLRRRNATGGMDGKREQTSIRKSRPRCYTGKRAPDHDGAQFLKGRMLFYAQCPGSSSRQKDTNRPSDPMPHSAEGFPLFISPCRQASTAA